LLAEDAAFGAIMAGKIQKGAATSGFSLHLLEVALADPD